MKLAPAAHLEHFVCNTRAEHNVSIHCIKRLNFHGCVGNCITDMMGGSRIGLYFRRIDGLLEMSFDGISLQLCSALMKADEAVYNVFDTVHAMKGFNKVKDYLHDSFVINLVLLAPVCVNFRHVVW